jgi:cytoskeleton protein RodZ
VSSPVVEAPSVTAAGADPSRTSPNSAVAPASAPTAAVTPSLSSAGDRAKASEPNSSNAGGLAVGEVQYHISFAKDSWVEIKDAGGERVLYGTQVAGTNLILKGKAPYSAVIGNAVHVKIEKKDGSTGASSVEQIVPMPKDTRQGIARLTIR